MSSKAKPFFIRITKDMTPQIIQDALDKCVDAGAIGGDSANLTIKKNDYNESYDFNEFSKFGVSGGNYTRFYNRCVDFCKDAIEITLDQLDKHLEVEPKSKFKVGDECVVSIGNLIAYHRQYLGKTGVIQSIFINKNDMPMATVEFEDGACVCFAQFALEKPETPEQREERERLETAIYLLDGNPNSELCTWEDASEELKEHLLWVVDKTNYRKS